ncbi:SGNH/GDSL hydrolase family protein [Mycobacterium avium]|uniref:SGNH/GDSL hydrolase family protein n=1 Tax=Mycobacterium avium TaxID=1764 RepID=UPI0003927526|nr:SGNH/GDSL hydrolase family protein [Mycobacterium avium]ETA93675.1 hydrolase [Mycobacterium avium 10-5581]ATO64578.2 SGNH/GDSL hydrolase family protein [Mycobacterium avium subsp. hominissuis]ATO69140.1 SGNH/GDSL hydrolase family protein [Mycobacterium avium subsp. hominissuis]ATO73673.1 SGNH/GDSL hydrolase family protein [Mycobacterium avium subsp. hominissuis]ETZ55982.1 GDSL-like Lipase/Acylhydrolase family protein [Mycobacterium avium MAV_120709_2344]
MKRYVALGSSMAAGPGIRPRAAGAPRWSGRSARNYAHLVAARCGYDLVDVTFSGATTAHVLTERQHGAAPQIAALDGSESLVTVTIGGNDVGYIPLLTVAALPRPLRRLPLLGDRIAELLDAEARNRALEAVFESLCAVGTAVRQRCAEARIFFVDYLTMLPPAGVPATPLSAADADLGRHVATTLERMTADAAAATGCDLIRAAAASREHHAWSADPWTTLPARYGLPLPGRPAPLHPNAAGMRAVAELIAARL